MSTKKTVKKTGAKKAAPKKSGGPAQKYFKSEKEYKKAAKDILCD